jgi:hypothetical protein
MYPTQKAKQIDCPRLLSRLAFFFFKQRLGLFIPRGHGALQVLVITFHHKAQGCWQGILNLNLMNISLLAKWFWNLFNEDGVWQRIFRLKYLSSKTFGHVESKPRYSHFWQGLMEAKKMFWPFCRIMVGNEMNTRFWEDHWINDQPLSLVFPKVFSISLNHEITVSKAFSMGIKNLKFRRVIVGKKKTNGLECVMFEML